MITSKSRKREIKDLQRLLLAVGVMELLSEDEDGKWGSATQSGVVLAYTRLGWDHPADGRWISAPALAAIASAMHHTFDGSGGAGAGGSNIGAGGSNIGAGGSNIGAGGSNIGAGGSNIGAGGSNIGAGGSNIGAGGSNIGGSGSHIGGSGSHIGSDSAPD